MTTAEQTDAADLPQPSLAVAGVCRGIFAELLQRLGVSLVLSTRPNHIVFVGADNGQLTLSATKLDQPLGMAADTTRIAVGVARSVIVFANASRLAASFPPIPDHFDAMYVPRLLHFTAECFMHDMILPAPPEHRPHP